MFKEATAKRPPIRLRPHAENLRRVRLPKRKPTQPSTRTINARRVRRPSSRATITTRGGERIAVVVKNVSDDRRPHRVLPRRRLGGPCLLSGTHAAHQDLGRSHVADPRRCRSQVRDRPDDGLSGRMRPIAGSPPSRTRHHFPRYDRVCLEPGKRDTWLAVKRGLRLACPACGRGRLMSGYLRQAEGCLHCGERTGDIRADDGPAWATILLVGHSSRRSSSCSPIASDTDAWPPFLAVAGLVLGLSLLLLPRMKGLFVGLIWASRAGEAEPG